MYIAEHQIKRTRTQQIKGRAHIIGTVAFESPSVQPFRQGVGPTEILANQEHIRS
jgi:hypothetical protein